MIFDHITLAVDDFDNSKKFFSKALLPLGIEVIVEFDQAAGLGRSGKPQFWLARQAVAQKPMHIAFAADTRAQVTAFHAQAVAAGGTDNGAPGIRKNYHPNYFAAFVISPDGHNVEAVCHAPEG
jgi:catechol 2,3-dioxygenase-like lactoylglutathione lyase family enzyme